MNPYSRRNFIKNSLLTGGYLTLLSRYSNGKGFKTLYPVDQISDFCKKLKPVGRILESKGYFVWCNSPIYGPDGKVHVFYSRWPEKYGMSGWIHQSEIAHAVADDPESEFKLTDVALSPRPGLFDATTCHNPHIKEVNGKYYLFYMGNSNGKTSTKRIGLASSDSLYGPWKKPDTPLLEVGEEGSWDDHCTTNPAVVKHPNGQFWLYYKSWNTSEYLNAPKGSVRGNRKYGLAVANSISGPYEKFYKNPVIDFSALGNNQQLEDAFVWYENGKFRLIARDMGFYDHKVGLYFESKDGIVWQNPEIAYKSLNNYVSESPAPSYLKRYGRLERPQVLFKNGKPEYLFTAAQGGSYNTSTGFLFSIKN